MSIRSFFQPKAKPAAKAGAAAPVEPAAQAAVAPNKSSSSTSVSAKTGKSAAAPPPPAPPSAATKPATPKMSKSPAKAAKPATPNKRAVPDKSDAKPPKAASTTTTPKKAAATPKKANSTPKRAKTGEDDGAGKGAVRKRLPLDDDEDDYVLILDDEEDVPKPKKSAPAPPKAATPKKAAAAAAAAAPPALKKTPQKKRARDSDDDDDDDGAAVTPASASAAPAKTVEKKKSAWRGPRTGERGAPPRAGQVEIPEGAPFCLLGRVFLITGVLDSLERADAEALIRRYGGETVKSVAKKLTHAIVGHEPGEAKLKKLAEQKVPLIDEAGLLAMIRDGAAQTPSKAVREKMAKADKVAREGKAPPPAVVQSIRAAADAGGGGALWTVKYAPRASGELLANRAAVKRVQDWLAAFPKKPITDKSFHRALLISGVPGIGKSTTAALVAREAGYDVIEFNASDARSRNRLREEGFLDIGGNRSMSEFYTKSGGAGKPDSAPGKARKVCIVMDEVDGMSSGDRGGNQELCALIKKTRVPIICICNDRQKSSVKTLANYCVDVRFARPNADDICGRLKVIMELEGFRHVDMGALKLLCVSVNNDVRQVLNLLQMLRLTTDRLDGTSQQQQQQQPQTGDGAFAHSLRDARSVALTPFAVVPALFSSAPRTVSDALQLFHHESDLMPLFVAENYLHAVPNVPPHAALASFANAADAVSMGDCVKEQLMRQQDWALLPFLGVISTVIPSAYTRGRCGKVEFPTWLGKNSNANKQKRLLKDLQVHMSAATGSSDKRDVRLDYVPHLVAPLLGPLRTAGKEGVAPLLALMQSYGITKDDWETVFVLSGNEKAIEELPAQVKSAFTRAYNKARPGAPSGGARAGRGGVARVADDDAGLMDDDVIAELEPEPEEEGDDDGDALKKDAMIKQKTKAPAKRAAAKPSKGAKPAKGAPVKRRKAASDDDMDDDDE